MKKNRYFAFAAFLNSCIW